MTLEELDSAASWVKTIAGIGCLVLPSLAPELAMAATAAGITSEGIELLEKIEGKAKTGQLSQEDIDTANAWYKKTQEMLALRTRGEIR